MPITKSAKKAQRKDSKKKIFNLRRIKKMRSAVKEIRELISDKKIEDAEKKISEAYKALDKAAKKGVIKKNTASRKKSRIAKAIHKAKH